MRMPIFVLLSALRNMCSCMSGSCHKSLRNSWKIRPKKECDNMFIFFQKKCLRFSTSSDRMTNCQLLVVATYPERKGGCPWQ